jgi:hypothetical protein
VFSKRERAPPKTESSAAKMAMERYFAMPREAFTVRIEPINPPITRLNRGKMYLNIKISLI